MTQPYFFGYGSLVNTATHDYPAPIPAQLSGWRRVWRHTAHRKVAYLSVTTDEASSIDGLLAHVPDNDWDALDIRESGYFRTPIGLDRLTLRKPPKMAVQIYQTNTDYPAPEDVRHPILLSYLDVVAQGFLNVFGAQGVARFFETTSGWEAPILNDRATPIYPRHQQLTAQQTQMVDDHLATLGADIQALTGAKLWQD